MKGFINIIIFIFFSIPIFADTIIEMEEYGGVYRIPCTVNGAKMKFIFDTGASNVCLSLPMAEYLYDNGYLEMSDIKGIGSSSVADGRIVDHITINLKDIKIGDQHLYNVDAVVIDGQNAPLLMGQSAIKKLGAIILDGSKLIIQNEFKDNTEFIENLLNEAQQAYSNEFYGRAVHKYGQLYSMNELSDYGKYKYAWALYMNKELDKALSILESFRNYEYFEKEKIDIYRLLGFLNEDLDRYNDAAKYFELSSRNIQTEQNEWLKNLTYMGDCYYCDKNYSRAAEQYRLAANLHVYMNGVDMKYIQRDSKNQLKKKETSFRNDDIDYILYQLFFCNERSGEWSTEGFLFEVTAMARAGNKYATKMLNKAGIDPYSSAWR